MKYFLDLLGFFFHNAGMNKKSPLLQVTGLYRSFGHVHAVRKMDFEIKEGSCVGLIGANGAGKTTLMRMLSTMDLPDGGDIYYNGQSVLAHPKLVRSLIGWMPDAMDTWQHTTVRDFLDFVARVYGFKGANRREIIDYWAKFTGIAPLLGRMMSKLSKGESQRLGLTRVLIGDPKFLIMDEPAAGLDPQARAQFKQLVQQLQAQGRTLLISSHILSELAEMCDSIIMMDKGRLLYAGSCDAFSQQMEMNGARRMRIRPLGDITALSAFLQQDSAWDNVVQQASWVDADSLHADDEALAKSLAELMAQHAFIEAKILQASLEQDFISILNKAH